MFSRMHKLALDFNMLSVSCIVCKHVAQVLF